MNLSQGIEFDEEVLLKLTREQERSLRVEQFSRLKSMVNEKLVCPISQSVMQDPVCGSDGHSYERTCIEQWLQGSGVSPMTREGMQRGLYTNFVLKRLVEQMRYMNLVES